MIGRNERGPSPAALQAPLGALLKRFVWFCLALTTASLTAAGPAAALDAREILVISNSKVPEGTHIARYYMKRRGIPDRNLLILSVTEEEQTSRREYEHQVARPIRRYLKDKLHASEIRSILTVYGMPLTISGSGFTAEEKVALLNLQKEKEVLQVLKEYNREKPKVLALEKKMAAVEHRIHAIGKGTHVAAVDSELSLVREGSYPLPGWLPNPLFVGHEGKRWKDMPTKILLVSRLDGPTPQIVRRMINDSLNAETKGLQGRAYFDARWPYPTGNITTAYALYDKALHDAARKIGESGLLTVTLDAKESLFQPGQGRKAALYSGWYSLGTYIDAFSWVPGAVGYHIASRELETLREPGSTVWGKSMLEKGAAVTIGPIEEPFIQAFPPPDLLFGLLLEGKKSLVECFFLSSPFLSWKMVLIGDPLYRPFKRKTGR